MEELTVQQAHEGFRSGRYTTRGLVEYFLQRIQSLDRNGPRINSILAISNTAITEADALDKHLSETSQLIGPLHGIPVLVKDQAETKGIVTTFGSRVFESHIPDADATLVKKLKGAGAIILAKTTIPGTSPLFIRH